MSSAALEQPRAAVPANIEQSERRPEPRRTRRPRRYRWLGAVPFLGLHLAVVSVFFVPVTGTALTLFFATWVLRTFGLTGGYHRYFAHRAFKVNRVMQFVLAWLGCSALQKGPIWWAAHHRKHHRESDQPDDVHSPIQEGFWWSHIGWILDESSEKAPVELVKDLTRYPELRWLDRHYWVPGLVLAVVCWLIGGWSGLVWGFVVSTVFLYHTTFMVNSVCHLLGSRRFETTDYSRNNLFVALLTMGEGWHNNHHYYQSSANQGFYWWEIDVTYYILKALSWVGLVRDLRLPPKRVLELGLKLDRQRRDGLAPVDAEARRQLLEATRTAVADQEAAAASAN